GERSPHWLKEDTMRRSPLRTLLFATLLVSSAQLLAQDRRAEQEQALAELKRLRGQVKRDTNTSDKPVISVDLHGTRITDAGLEQLRSFNKIQILNLYNTKIGDAGLAHVAGLTSLTTLYLNYTPVTNAGLVHLKGLVRLQQLGLYHTQVTDE